MTTPDQDENRQTPPLRSPRQPMMYVHRPSLEAPAKDLGRFVSA